MRKALDGMATGTAASRSERVAALMSLFRQQELALAAEHAKQRSALMMVMDEHLDEPKSERALEFTRGVSEETVASSMDLCAVKSEQETVDCQDAAQTISKDECKVDEVDSFAIGVDTGGAPSCLHGVYDVEAGHTGYSAAQEGECTSGVCERQACERGAGVARCDHLTSEGPRADCIRTCAVRQVGECGSPKSPSHAFECGGRSSPCLSSGRGSDSEGRGRKRRSPEDGLVFDDDSVEDDATSDSGSQSHQATWAATLTQVEHELANHGLSAAVTLAVESIGCKFKEAPPQLTCHGWVSMASVVHEDYSEELYQTAGVHQESKRAARRSAYGQVLQYATTQIAANMVKAFRPNATHSGLHLEDLHHHLHTRIKDLLQRAARGRTTSVETCDGGVAKHGWPTYTGYQHNIPELE